MENVTNVMENNFCLPFAYSYVPITSIGKVYDTQTALSRGTLFPELDKPICVYGKEFLKFQEENK